MQTKHLTVMFTDLKNFTDKSSRQTRQELLRLLELHDDLVRPIFQQFGGNIVKTVGDAFLVTFESPTDAVLCGIDIQKNLRKHNKEVEHDEKMEVRIAINAGEVTIKNDDVFGEAVNIASRIEGIAEPDEIYFTEAVYLAMNKSEVPSSEVGHRHLKGIPHEIKVYKVLWEPGDKTKSKVKLKSKAARYSGSKGGRLSLIKKLLIGIATFLVIVMLANNQYGEFNVPLLIALYIYLAHSFKVIADKTKTNDSYLAWLPIINIFYWVDMAKKPRWWYLMFLIPGVNLVFMTLTWMEMASLLNKSKWLGILVLIPGVNLAYVGYLAYSKK
jgi:class 3 adenylate cyclase